MPFLTGLPWRETEGKVAQKRSHHERLEDSIRRNSRASRSSDHFQAVMHTTLKLSLGMYELPLPHHEGLSNIENVSGGSELTDYCATCVRLSSPLDWSYPG